MFKNLVIAVLCAMLALSASGYALAAGKGDDKGKTEVIDPGETDNPGKDNGVHDNGRNNADPDGGGKNTADGEDDGRNDGNNGGKCDDNRGKSACDKADNPAPEPDKPADPIVPDVPTMPMVSKTIMPPRSFTCW